MIRRLKTTPHQDAQLLHRYTKLGRLAYQGLGVGIESCEVSNARYAILERRGVGNPMKYTVLYVRTKDSQKRAFKEIKRFLDVLNNLI